MKELIKQSITKDETVYIFTDNPQEDIKIFQKAYKDQDELDKESEIPLGYEMPSLFKFNFLGKEYPCIGLWFDNEDIPEIYN